MSEMIERVARALYTAHYERGRGLAPFWDNLDRFEKEMWEFSARAAIAAMREPTDAMAFAVDGDWGPQLEDNWRKMIDEALK